MELQQQSLKVGKERSYDFVMTVGCGLGILRAFRWSSFDGRLVAFLYRFWELGTLVKWYMARHACLKELCARVEYMN